MIARAQRWTFVVALVLGASSAHAEPDAEQLFLEGEAAYKREDYSEAIERWRASYRLSKLPILVYYIGNAYRLSGDCRRAVAQYRRFLARETKSNPKERGYAKEFLAELRCDAASDVDERGTDERSGASTSTSTSTSTLKIAGLTTGGVGVGLVIGGLVLGHRSSTSMEEVESACTIARPCIWAEQRDKYAAAKRDASIATALDVTGAIAIVAGVAMYLAGRRHPTTTTEVTVTRSSDGAMVRWSARW